MSTDFSDYRRLSIDQRLELVTEIWNSIADEADSISLPLSTAQTEELSRRRNEHLRDPSSSIPWSEVRKLLFRDQPSK